MNCRIKISTAVDGQESYFSASASLKRMSKEGYRVEYFYDDDFCVLEIFDDAVTQKREGVLGMQAGFSRLGRSFIAMESEEGRAELPVECKKLSCECFRRGIFCTLCYTLAPCEYVVKIAVVTDFDLSAL